MKISLSDIKNWFRTGLKPTQQQFWNTFDSFWHKDEIIPINQIENLMNILQQKADKQAFDLHLSDTSAHSSIFHTKVDKVDGKHLSSNDFTDDDRIDLDVLKSQAFRRTKLVNLGSITGSIESSFNTQDPAIEIKTGDFLTVVALIDGQTKRYALNKGKGFYGAGELQTTNEDFVLISDETKMVVRVQDVTAVGQIAMGVAAGINAGGFFIGTVLTVPPTEDSHIDFLIQF